MTSTYHNLCIRCGKERVVVRTWIEKVGYSTVTNTLMACPDPECQKLVTAENRKQTNKYKEMKRKSEDRMKKRYATAKLERAKSRK